MAKVIVIDDDNYLTEDFKFFIEAAGHECKVMSNADSVVDALDGAFNYDVVVLDIMLQSGTKVNYDNDKLETGEKLYYLIRKKDKYIKIIIVSAKNKRELNIDIDCDDNVLYLKKPISNDASEIIDNIS